MGVKQLSDCYKGKRVFVTGHTGFKGAWLCWWLRSLGAEVAGYSLAPEAGRESLFALTHLDGAMHSTIGDIREVPLLSKTLHDFKPDIVFHMAAQALVRRSYREPVSTYEVNVMGTVYLLEAIRNCSSVTSIVNVTTDKCYENHEREQPYREDDPLGGRDPYSSSKAASEIVTAAYRHSFLEECDKQIATARAGNVIGGGDYSEDRILPDCIRAVQGGKAVELRNPSSTRPWQHVLDACYGYLLLGLALENKALGEHRAFNFSPMGLAPVRTEELVKIFFTALGEGTYSVGASDTSMHEATQLQLDASLARKLLGWEAKLGVKSAVEWSAAWYKIFLAGGDTKAFTETQIRDYELLLSAS